MGLNANGLDDEQQALLASIMGKSSQQGGGFSFGQTAATAEPVSDVNSNRLMNQSEIDALIASMTQ